MAGTKRNIFIERSLMETLFFFKESVFSEEYASRKAFLQSIDGRIKLVTFVVFLTAVLFTKSVLVVFSFYALCLALAGFSGIDMLFFLKRTWVFIPLFALFIALPALFSVFTPGEAICVLKISGVKFVITRQGLFGAVLFVLRVAASVSFAVLLSVTTRHSELLKVLRVFRVPRIFVMIFGMCYRYIYLFMEVIFDTYMAVKSRIGRQMPCAKGQRVVAWNIASLWYRSYRMNEAVYDAMVARGYNGEPVMFNDFRTRPRDWVWLAFSVIISAGLLYLGYKLKGNIL